MFDLKDAPECIYEMRNLAHHRAFCTFVAREQDKACDNIRAAQEVIEDSSRLEAAGVFFSTRLGSRRTEAAADLVAAQTRLRELDLVLCTANDFMNV